MKLPCKIIEDMIPIYYDKVCSEESALLVEEHLKSCAHCRQILSDLRTDINILENQVDDIKPLKKLQKSYKKMRVRWLITILCILALIPLAFFIGNDSAEQKKPEDDFSQEEALACANAFMDAITEGNYEKAFSYWDVEAKRFAWLRDHDFSEEDLANLESDGLKKFCEQGQKLEELGGIESSKFIDISDTLQYDYRGKREYDIRYRVKFDGKEEGFHVTVTENGICVAFAADGLIAHPLSLITMWGEWLWQDYQGCYYDFDMKEYVYYNKQ